MLYTDIGKTLPLLMQFPIYLTPVVFPMPKSGWGAVIFSINPMTPLILTTRDWLTSMPPAHIGAFAVINGFLLLLLPAGWIIYRAAMPDK